MTLPGATTALAALTVAALAVALGATEGEADSVWARLQSQPIPAYPSDAIGQVRAALAAVRGEG